MPNTHKPSKKSSVKLPFHLNLPHLPLLPKPHHKRKKSSRVSDKLLKPLITFSELFLPQLSRPSSLFHTLLPPPKNFRNIPDNDQDPIHSYEDSDLMQTEETRISQKKFNIAKRQPATQGMVRPWWSNSISKRKLEIPSVEEEYGEQEVESQKEDPKIGFSTRLLQGFSLKANEIESTLN